MNKILAILFILISISLKAQPNEKIVLNDLMNIFNSGYSNAEDYLLQKGFQLSSNQVNEHGVRYYQFYSDQTPIVIVIVDFQEKTQAVRMYTNNLNDYLQLKKDIKEKGYKEGMVQDEEFGSVIWFSKDSSTLKFVAFINSENFKYGVEYTTAECIFITWGR